MSWRDRLQQASFRGVEFHIEQAGGDGGRRVALHQYPQQEQHWAEDLGRKADEQRLTAFVVGADYDLARDRLMQALEAKGPGTLVHPHLGILRVQIQDYDWTISTREGGLCTFNIRYVPAGARQYPAAHASQARTLVRACDSAVNSVESTFNSAFNATAQPDFVLDAAVGQLSDAADALRQVNGRLSAALAPVSATAAAIDGLGSQLNALILQPRTLVQQVLGVVASLFGAYADIAAAFDGYQSLVVGFNDLAPVPTTTATRLRQRANQTALRDLLLTASSVELARVIATLRTPFATYNQAIRVRDEVLNQLDLIAETGDDAQYYALVELRTALIRRVDEVAPGLGRIDTLTLSRSVPALVLAHQVYGDASRGDELAERNSLAHPTFVPAGVAIEVLLEARA